MLWSGTRGKDAPFLGKKCLSVNVTPIKGRTRARAAARGGGGGGGAARTARPGHRPSPQRRLRCSERALESWGAGQSRRLAARSRGALGAPAGAGPELGLAALLASSGQPGPDPAPTPASWGAAEPPPPRAPREIKVRVDGRTAGRTDGREAGSEAHAPWLFCPRVHTFTCAPFGVGGAPGVPPQPPPPREEGEHHRVCSATSRSASSPSPYPYRGLSRPLKRKKNSVTTKSSRKGVMTI